MGSDHCEVGVYYYALEVAAPREVTPVLISTVHSPAAEATLFYSRTQNNPQFVEHSSFDTFQVAPCTMTL